MEDNLQGLRKWILKRSIGLLLTEKGDKAIDTDDFSYEDIESDESSDAGWSGDDKEILYEVQGWPTNMVVDLGNRTCSCRFWQLTGMPYMHAISAIQEKNDKRSEEYCHKWLTMDVYRRTYQYNKTGSPAPVPPPINPKPGRPTTKRRKDKAERPTGTKTKMKRKYNPIRCMYCGEVGYNKRICSKIMLKRRQG
ncbi:hypothetical protein Ahy_B09g098794 [Arachis hypogaea]|uniref:SWIM-type domain-containing protein n=1 Tax=Arachis hypogaea TaxID=3818 RepID=A0A444XS36_ARAHY|nr:hypothetical protein Ahy_B09g098794 [Arachis hypogaea]